MASLAGGSSLGDLYSKCVQLVNENKISTKNAFELPLIEHMDDIVDSFMGVKKKKAAEKKASSSSSRKSSIATTEEQEAENRFHEASCTIEASARIYACRVDCVHTDTYRVLGGLSSADMGEEDGQPGEDGKPTKKRRICGVNTLEKNEANLVQQNIEADEQSDPMFRRMAAAFDAGGAKGLLLSHLPVAEDCSLVFNGDVSLCKAQALAEPLFATPQKTLRADNIGLGDPGTAAAKVESSKLCPEVDGFRRQLWNDSSSFAMPKALETLLGAAVTAGPSSSAAVAASQQALPLMDAAADVGGPDMGDFGAPDMEQDVSFGGCSGAAMPSASEPMSLPLLDVPGSHMLAAPGGSSSKDDVVAFDELFEKFCGAGGSNQFAYFDECWAKQSREKDDKALTALADAQPECGALVPAEGKERGQKRPLFDLSGLDKAAKPIETEPVAKHQLSERAAQWQLHKDVPPYMIDRITMPSWQTWSKCDFACLGLRPHLMLKLVKKPPPPGDGPHAFSDLFSTVVVENPEAFPWLSSDYKSSRRAGDEDEDTRGNARDDFGEDGGDEYGDSGLPSHLDVDPQELFLGPDDKVVPGCDGEDLGDLGEDVADAFMPDGLDFDLADAPTTAENIDIGYSRNSKFVDVKLVKKHLWGCLEQDIAGLEEAGDKKSKERQIANESFQDLVGRTVSKMPKGECENLSVAVCFICALHLCNEKNLELKVDPEKPLGDFAVVAPP